MDRTKSALGSRKGWTRRVEAAEIRQAFFPLGDHALLFRLQAAYRLAGRSWHRRHIVVAYCGLVLRQAVEVLDG